MISEYETVSSSQPARNPTSASFSTIPPVHGLLAIPVADVGCDFAVDELPRRAADQLLLRCERQIHNDDGAAHAAPSFFRFA